MKHIRTWLAAAANRRLLYAAMVAVFGYLAAEGLIDGNLRDLLTSLLAIGLGSMAIAHAKDPS